jgi:hypothetical protein
MLKNANNNQFNYQDAILLKLEQFYKFPALDYAYVCCRKMVGQPREAILKQTKEDSDLI